jgi:hypothetical protein
VPGGRRLVDPVVDPHEVSVFSELGDDLSSAYALSLACDRCDRHEALLRGSVYSALDRLESFRRVAVCRGLVCWSIRRELVGGDVFKVLVLSRP